MSLKVLLYPNKSLVTPTREVVQFGKNIRQLGNNMLDLMEQQNGLGLAANQVGIDLSFFVTIKPYDYYDGKWPQHDIICNPTWKPTLSRFKYFRVEGCLSFPGWLLPIKRYGAIIAEYQTYAGKRVKIVLHGLAARVFQHETEHLEGKSFLAHLTNEQRETIRKYYMRRR